MRPGVACPDDATFAAYIDGSLARPAGDAGGSHPAGGFGQMLGSLIQENTQANAAADAAARLEHQHAGPNPLRPGRRDRGGRGGRGIGGHGGGCAQAMVQCRGDRVVWVHGRSIG